MQLRLSILLAILSLPAWCKAATTLPTIDLIEISTRNAGLPHTYTVGQPFLLLVEETAKAHLSTGEVRTFGAGGSSGSTAPFVSTADLGGQLKFSFSPISGGRFFERASFNAGAPYVRTGFRLDLLGPLTLIAQKGSFNAVLSGTLRVAQDGLASPFQGTDEALLGAAPGDLIPFSVTYTRLGSPWSATSFSSSFSYTMSARLVTAAIPEPGVTLGVVIGFAWAGLRRRRRGVRDH